MYMHTIDKQCQLCSDPNSPRYCGFCLSFP